MRTGVVGAGVCLFVAGCTTVPRLDFDGVAVTEIVQRVKCEIAYAVPETTGKFPAGDFQWLKYWTAHVELQLETTEQSTISPTVSYVNPMTNVILAGIAPIARNLNVGVQGKLDDKAYRNDNLSFTIAVNELNDVKLSQECREPHERGLLGKLGLQEWIESSLAPVANRNLTIGYHEAPAGVKGGAKIPGPSLPKTVARETPKSLLDQAQMKVAAAEEEVVNTLNWANKAYASALATDMTRPEQLQRTYNLVDSTYADVEKTTKLTDAAEDFAWRAERLNRDNLKEEDPTLADKIEVLRKESEDALKPRLDAIDATKPEEEKKMEASRLRKEAEDWLQKKVKELKAQVAHTSGSLPEDEMDKELKKVRDDIKAVTERATKSTNIAKAAFELLPRDLPIDSISHQVIFTVTANGGVTPNWTLVYFRGSSSQLLFGEKIRKHTLNIVMGQPQTPGGKDLSDEQARQLFWQNVNSRGALAVVPVQ